MGQFVFARNFLRELIVCAIAFERCFPHQTAAFDAELFLRDRERISASDFAHLHTLNSLPTNDGEVRIRHCTQEVTIEAGLLRNARSFFHCPTRIRQLIELWHLSPVTQWDCDRIVDVTGRDECRYDQLAFDWLRSRAFFCDRDLHKIAGVHTELFCISRTHQCSIVPGQLCDWVWQFLQPSVIGVATIVHFITGCKHNLWRIRCRCWRQCPLTLKLWSNCVCIECGGLITRLNVRSRAVVKESGPCSLKIARRIGGSKSFLHEFGPLCFWAAEQHIEQFNFRKAAEEREDHWLDRQVIPT